jgi:hypothetical protein
LGFRGVMFERYLCSSFGWCAHDRRMVHVLPGYFTSHPKTQDDVTMSMYFRKHADQFHDVHALNTAEVLAC